MTLTFKYDPVGVKTNHCTEYLGHRSCLSTVIVQIHSGPTRTTIATDVARSVVCVSVSGTFLSYAKTAEGIEMLFGEGVNHVGPRNYVL